MKKKTVVTVFVSVLLLWSIVGTRLTMQVNAPALHDVYPGESIQEVINSAQMGDVIFVHEGTYSQQVFVNKSLTLIGEDANTTIIEGVRAHKASYVKISGFTIRRSIHGIDLDECNSITISGNIVTGNMQYGIFVVNSRNIIISGNIILNNGDRGVYLRYSSYNTVSNNTVSIHSEYGILLFHSDNNVISDNTVSNNWYGIRLDSSSNNSVFGNTITNNDLGISSITCSNNICYNNFINNTIQVKGLFSSNVWDNGYPSGGNYWSDYVGVDSNSDGIGDSPRTIDASNIDNFPLMGMLSSFTTFLGHKVNVISNSTIDDFEFFKSPANITIRLHVSNMTSTQTSGFCSVSIPHILMAEPYNVTIDGAEPNYVNYTLYDNETHRWIYFNYDHSTLEVVIQGTDNTPPTISILSPENKTYPINNVPLTFTVNEPTSLIGYSLDGQMNVTIGGNTTIAGLSEGVHTITVYANDTAGNIGSSEIAEPLQPWIVAIIVIIAVVGAALLVYFAKVKKTTEKAK
jgi:parallel beta-helix repeat protein